MTVAGNFTAQSMILQGPKDFNWAMFPLLKGKTQEQVANPQTYSISAQSTNKQSAMFFLAYLVNKQNLAKLALGDWLIPSNPDAGKLARKSTKRGSWTIATSWSSTSARNWVSLAAYPRWKAGCAPRSSSTCAGNRPAGARQAAGDGWTRAG
jgi:hypothetical protein